MIIHMVDREKFLYYLCGKGDEPNDYGNDWTFDEKEVTCEDCIAEIIDRRFYFTLLRKMKTKQTRGIIA